MNDDFIDDVIKLRNYIEANIRASTKTGIEFIDPRRFKSQVINKQNHIIFGRRGSGKSSLLNEIVKNEKFSILINLESYKDISFPNIIVHIMERFFIELLNLYKTNTPALSKLNIKYHKLVKDLTKEIKELTDLKNEQDQFTEEIRQLEKEEKQRKLSGSTAKDTLTGSGEYSKTKGVETERHRTILNVKLDQLKNKIEHFKALIERVTTENIKPLYLLLDDFYFIKIYEQPYLADFLHLLTKDTNLFLKVATIKHRTKLYIAKETYIGMELGSGDTQEIDLDYTLDKFDSVKSFMTDILKTAVKSAGVEIDQEDLFSGEGFNQLCIASGGVPRDFLTLLVKSVTNYIVANGKKIGKIEVNEEAIANLSNKHKSNEIDISDEVNIIDLYVTYIKDYIFKEKHTNCFLVSHDQLRSITQGKQAINNLFDLRLIHLVDKNTSSAPSTKKRYEAYLIDVGLYENSRPLKFKQIDPIFKDDKSRKNDLRASPKIDLEKLVSEIKERAEENGLIAELEPIHS